MSQEDSDLRGTLESAELRGLPAAARREAVRHRMMDIAGAPGRRPRRPRVIWAALLLVVGVSAAGLGGTQAGRDLVRSIFTPVQPTHSVMWSPSELQVAEDGTPTKSAYAVVRNAGPFSPEEAEATKAQLAEVHEIAQAGGGRLVGLIEVPGTGEAASRTIYQVEYTLSTGQSMTVGGSRPTDPQAANMRIDEIMALREAGAGLLISQEESPLGLGRYVIRFTLSDGQTVDLRTWYPPGTAQERAAIFAETRRLKAERRFSVVRASSDANAPREHVWGVLQYTLSDGRTVGISERVPADVLTPDGTHVEMPE